MCGIWCQAKGGLLDNISANILANLEFCSKVGIKEQSQNKFVLSRQTLSRQYP